MLWCCWLGGWKGIRPVKTERWGAGMVICLEQGAVKSRLVLPFWYRLTWVVLDKGLLNGCVCAWSVCVCAHACVRVCYEFWLIFLLTLRPYVLSTHSTHSVFCLLFACTVSRHYHHRCVLWSFYMFTICRCKYTVLYSVWDIEEMNENNHFLLYNVEYLLVPYEQRNKEDCSCFV